MPSPKTETVEFQCAYGVFQSRYLWFIPFLGVVGPIFVVSGIFWNKGWAMGGRPLEPWQATLFLEVLGLGAIATAAYAAMVTRKRKKSPQRIAVTKSSLIAPKSLLSDTELVLPRAEIKLKVFNAGFVKQLQIMHGRRKKLLTSALCPSDEDFEQLVSHLLPD